MTRYDDTDWRITYSGTGWRSIGDAQASGGNFHTLDSNGYVSLTFTGTSLAWIATTGLGFGSAQVTLDDQAPVVVDTYRPTAPDQYQVEVWSTGELAAGTHTLLIQWLGPTHNGMDYHLSVDAFDVAGTLVDPTGTIAGTVKSTSGSPVANVRVSAFDHDWNELGYAVTNGSGGYSIAGLPKVSVAVCTLLSYNYVGEWYDNVALPGNWEAHGATWLDLAATPSRSGVNFALQPGLSISGKVTSSGGTGLAGVLVSAYDLNGNLCAQALSNGGGTYVIQGLPYGKYHVATENLQNYIDEWYNNVRFIGNPGATGAATISLSSSSGNPSGINFALSTGRRISGTVRDANSGLSDVFIDVYNLSGVYLCSGLTNDYGAYTVGGLPAGQYRIATYSNSVYVDEWYNNDPYLLDPKGASATSVDVRTASATGKNFVLARGRMISGRVTSSSGMGLQVQVHVQAVSGVFETTEETDPDGSYWIEGLVPGSYVINTVNDRGYVDEWYDNDPAVLDLSGAKAKRVAVSTADVAGINFALDKGFTMSGHVTQGLPGHGPVPPGVRVGLYSASGKFYGGPLVEGDPVYTTYALPAGTYYAKLLDYFGVGFEEQWYKGLSVPQYGLASATPIDLIHTNATGIDFAVKRANRYDQTNSAIPKSGTWVNFATSAAYNGSYGRSSTTGASAAVCFTGTRLDWITTRGTTAGSADVYVDGVKKATVNLNATTVAYQQNVWSTGTLSNGTHTVVFVRSSSSPAGTYLTLDAVNVYGSIKTPSATMVRYEQTSSLVKYVGTWSSFSNSHASGGSYGRSSTSGASATVKFIGARLDWIATRGTTGGKVDVYVDGVKKTATPVNLYASAVLYQANVYSTGTLPFGLHTVNLVRSSTSASGKYITLDAFGVWGRVTG